MGYALHTMKHTNTCVCPVSMLDAVSKTHSYHEMAQQHMRAQEWNAAGCHHSGIGRDSVATKPVAATATAAPVPAGSDDADDKSFSDIHAGMQPGIVRLQHAPLPKRHSLGLLVSRGGGGKRGWRWRKREETGRGYGRGRGYRCRGRRGNGGRRAWRWGGEKRKQNGQGGRQRTCEWPPPTPFHHLPPCLYISKYPMDRA